MLNWQHMRVHSKIVGYPFRDELFMIRSFLGGLKLERKFWTSGRQRVKYHFLFLSDGMLY